jgi:hypothetical protein
MSLKYAFPGGLGVSRNPVPRMAIPYRPFTGEKKIRNRKKRKARRYESLKGVRTMRRRKSFITGMMTESFFRILPQTMGRGFQPLKEVTPDLFPGVQSLFRGVFVFIQGMRITPVMKRRGKQGIHYDLYQRELKVSLLSTKSSY